MSDANLLRLEAKFLANRNLEEQAADSVEDLDAEFDRLRKRMRKAQRKLERKTQDGARLFEKIMDTRATTLAGLLVKMRDGWSSDDESSEIAILRSLMADMKAMTEAQS
ncbi:hypothetical protein [Mesorhizobium sp. A556]